MTRKNSPPVEQCQESPEEYIVVRVVDRASGEVWEERRERWIKRAPLYGGRDFLTVFQKKLDQLAEDREMKWLHWRVFVKIAAQLENGNKVAVNQRALAERLGIQPSHISRVLRELVERKILERTEGVGGVRYYYLARAYGWKGGEKRWRTQTRRLRREMEAEAKREGERHGQGLEALSADEAAGAHAAGDRGVESDVRV